MNPEISIVIPDKDCESTISRSIKSVLEQTHRNFEIVLVNNNCLDKTIEIVESFKDERIKNWA